MLDSFHALPLTLHLQVRFFLSLYSHLPDQEILGRIWTREAPNLDWWISLHAVTLIFEIIIEQQPCEEHLNLICRKESPWTSVFAVSKSQIVLVSRDKEVACMVRN